MNKILKILSILIIGFVMFSCSTPTNDPVEETPEVPTHSIKFTAKKEMDQPIADFLNSLPDYKNLKEGTEVELPTIVYLTEEDICTLDPTNCEIRICYEGNSNLTSVIIGNEDIEIKIEKTIFDDQG